MIYVRVLVIRLLWPLGSGVFDFLFSWNEDSAFFFIAGKNDTNIFASKLCVDTERKRNSKIHTRRQF